MKKGLKLNVNERSILNPRSIYKIYETRNVSSTNTCINKIISKKISNQPNSEQFHPVRHFKSHLFRYFSFPSLFWLREVYEKRMYTNRREKKRKKGGRGESKPRGDEGQKVGADEVEACV